MNIDEMTYVKHAPPRLDIKGKCVLYLHARYAFKTVERAEAMFQKLLAAHETGEFDNILRAIKSLKKYKTRSQHDPHSKNETTPVRVYYEEKMKDLAAEKETTISTVQIKKSPRKKRLEKKVGK
jgi:uncharacterized protein Smg (DUF494 family)